MDKITKIAKFMEGTLPKSVLMLQGVSSVSAGDGDGIHLVIRHSHPHNSSGDDMLSRAVLRTHETCPEIEELHKLLLRARRFEREARVVGVPVGRTYAEDTDWRGPREEPSVEKKIVSILFEAFLIASKSAQQQVLKQLEVEREQLEADVAAFCNCKTKETE